MYVSVIRLGDPSKRTTLGCSPIREGIVLLGMGT